MTTEAARPAAHPAYSAYPQMSGLTLEIQRQAAAARILELVDAGLCVLCRRPIEVERRRLLREAGQPTMTCLGCRDKTLR